MKDDTVVLLVNSDAFYSKFHDFISADCSCSPMVNKDDIVVLFSGLIVLNITVLLIIMF